MKNTFELIREEIAGKVDAVRAADREAAKQAQAIRNDYEQAMNRKAAALDAQNMDDYRAAGMDAEALRLDLEFIEKGQEKAKKPAAGADDDSRIRAALAAEKERIRVDAVAQLKSIFDEAASVAAAALKQFDVLDGLYTQWKGIVMREPGNHTVCAGDDRLGLSQLENGAKAQINKIGLMKG